MKKSHAIVFVIFGLSLAYAAGWRIIALSEVPASHRPWMPFLTADYASQHLSPAHDIMDIFGEK